MTVHVASVGDVSAVLAELRSARLRAAQTGGEAAPRVTTLNFIVFVDDANHREWVLERATRVTEKHPARLLVLDSTRDDGGVDVSTPTRETQGATVMTERVDLSVGQLDHASIHSLAQELSVPDIPTVLWWTGRRLLASRTFQGLSDQASSVLVDSSGSARDAETIRELGEFVSRFPRVALHDLAFMRLLPWQDMIAQFFDEPALREDLFSLNAVSIESGSEAEALYLAGWLGSRLSWEPVDATSFRTRDGRTVAFTKVARGGQRRVARVELASPDSQYVAELSEDDPNVVRLRVEGAGGKEPWWVPLQSIDNTSLIEKSILESGHDQIFEVSLLTVRDLLG